MKSRTSLGLGLWLLTLHCGAWSRHIPHTRSRVISLIVISDSVTYFRILIVHCRVSLKLKFFTYLNICPHISFYNRPYRVYVINVSVSSYSDERVVTQHNIADGVKYYFISPYESPSGCRVNLEIRVSSLSRCWSKIVWTHGSSDIIVNG